MKRSVVEIVESWNNRITEMTRKKDVDKKKDKPVPVDLDSTASEESILSSESQENNGKNISIEKDSLTLSKKVKSLDSSDSRLLQMSL